MNLRNRFLATFGAAALLATTTLTGLAAPTGSGNATVAITSNSTDNVLAVTIDNATFGSIPYSFTDKPTSGTLNLTVSDTRGTAAGWNVVLSADNFTGAVTQKSIPAGKLSLAAGSITATAGNGNVSSPNQSSFVVGSVDGVGQRIWNAQPGFGDGAYKLAVTGNLTVPGGTLVDTYTSVVTVSINAGPGGN